MSIESGVSSGCHLGPFYYEKTTNGDINFGVAFGPSGGEGVVGGVESYAEVSFNPKDGFSAGVGTSAEAGVGVNVGPGLKDLSGGIYSTAYTCFDSRK